MPMKLVPCTSRKDNIKGYVHILEQRVLLTTGFFGARVGAALAYFSKTVLNHILHLSKLKNLDC